jgi:uncharacterized phage protein gp47/JayE
MYTIKSQEQITNDILLDILENVSSLNDANIGSVFRQHVESISKEIKLLYDTLEAIYDSTRISTATGSDLDELGALVAKTRIPGTNASGYTTFQRNAPATSNFSIAAGNIVSTQPNIGNQQLNFIVNANTTFMSSITNEQHDFYPGTWEYQFNERFVANSSAITITGYATSTSLVYSFNNGSDFQIYNNYNDFLVDTNTLSEVELCIDTSGVTKSTDAETLDLSTTTKYNDYSWKMGKTGTSSNDAYYYKTLGSNVNMTNLWLSFYIYTLDATVRGKINYIDIYLGNSGISNSYQFRLEDTDLKTTNWGRYRFRYNDSTTIVNGNPDVSAINYIRVNIVTNNASDTLTSGDVLMSYAIVSNTVEYIGDVVQWLDTTSPITSTIYYVNYTPLSKEVLVTAETSGIAYNVAINKINYKVSNIPSINSVNNYVPFINGTDVESDSAFKERIQRAAQSQGKATAEAIRQAALNVPGITSAMVEDMPLTSVTSELHLYSSGVAIYQLEHEVIYHDASPPANITITGTASATSYTFAYGTDYLSIVDSNNILLSQIQWQGGGTAPDDNTYFNTAYEYNWLGHVYVYLTSSEGTPSTSLLTVVSSAVESTKAAGVTVHLISPTTIYESVIAGIKTDSSHSLTDVQDALYDSIRGYINVLGVADDVYLAKLYDVMMDVTGVTNVNITTPSSDVTITTSQVARCGTITLSSL